MLLNIVRFCSVRNPAHIEVGSWLEKKITVIGTLAGVVMRSNLCLKQHGDNRGVRFLLINKTEGWHRINYVK